MIVQRDIACWLGSVATPNVGGQDELWQLLDLCDQVVAAFESDAVLRVSTIVLDDWMRDGELIAGQHEVSLDRRVDDSIRSACRRWFDDQRIELNVVASTVTLRGLTRIREPDEKNVDVADAVCIRAMLTGRYLFSIHTSCDAWLPCELLGAPQPERYGLNAPRLREALTRTNAILGGALWADRSKLAVVNGFEIGNIPTFIVRSLLGLPDE